MTDRERKDYYLKRIEKILTHRKIWMRLLPSDLKSLAEEIKIIRWNNGKEWAENFISEEVEPLLKKHGIVIAT